MNKATNIDISSFYPIEGLMLTDVQKSTQGILIKLVSTTTTCKCPKCHVISNRKHGTYVRKVQDLPVWGQNVRLEVTVHEYCCDNGECDAITITESFNGFFNNYCRMTDRLEDFICTLALETSCEGAARICKHIGLNISGDTIIRLLLRCYKNKPDVVCSEVVGVDDFAFKKRHTYGKL